MRYYSTLRPVGIGTFPKPTENKVLSIENFNSRIYVHEINHEAWGYIEYEKPLSEKEAQNYDLVSANEVVNKN